MLMLRLKRRYDGAMEASGADNLGEDSHAAVTEFSVCAG